MAEFKAIETQEQLDAIMSDRINRLNAKHSEATAELQSQLKELTDQLNVATEQNKANAEKYAGYDEKMAEMQKQIKRYETDSVKTKVAREEGIPFELFSRISGTTEEEMREDARNLAKFIRKPVAPMASAEPSRTSTGNQSDIALDAWLKEIK